MIYKFSFIDLQNFAFKRKIKYIELILLKKKIKIQNFWLNIENI
jgi:hypothetical protein